MAIHISKGSGPPSTLTPLEIGQHYIDVTNRNLYQSVGTSSPADWVQVGGSDSSFTTFLSLLDTPVSYNSFAGLFAKVNSGQTALEFGSPAMTDLGDVDLAGLLDNMIIFYDVVGQKFKPSYRMEWKGDWQAGTYKKHQVVNDSGWTMIALTETTDRAAPQPTGESAWQLPETPSWSTAQTAPLSVQGLRFTVGDFSTIDGFRFYRATNTGNEEYSYYIQDLTDPANPRMIGFGSLPQGPIGWAELSLTGTFYYEGQVIDIQFVTSNSTGSTQWSHEWTKISGNGGDPSAGEYTVNDNFDELRIHITDDGSNDTSADLDLLKIGDEIQFIEANQVSRYNTYQVSGTPTYILGDTVLVIPCLRVGNGQDVRVGNLCNGNGDIKTGSLPSDYVFLSNYWFLNPPTGGGTVNGYIKSDLTTAPSLNDNAYGVDVSGYGWTISDDWEVITTTLGGGGSGGGSGGVDSFLELTDTPSSYGGQQGKIVQVRSDELGLEFVENEGGGEVSSVFGRTGDVVSQTGDYSAAQVGAYTEAETDSQISTAISNHEAAENPHPQYITGDELPGLAISFLTGLTSSIDGAYLQTSQTELGNPENSVQGSTSLEETPEIISQYLREPVFAEAGTLLATGAKYTLDIDSSDNNIDLRIEFGLRLANASFDILGTVDHPLTIGRSVITVDVTIPTTEYAVGDTSFTRYYMIKKTGSTGGTKTVTIYQEGTYTSKAITSLPGQAIPAPHAASHEVGGSDQVLHDNLSGAQGYQSHATIDSELADHETRITTNEADIIPVQQATVPQNDRTGDKTLKSSLTGVGSFTITDSGSFNTNGTFRFTQFATDGDGEEFFGDATIAGGVLTGLPLFRNVGNKYAVNDLITLTIPDASENVKAVIRVDSLVQSQAWETVTIPPQTVTSVFGRTGDVVAEFGDYNADLIDDASTTNKFASQAQIDQIATNTGDIATKQDEITATTTDDYYQGDKTFQPKLGLPISTATQTALDGKEPTLPLTTRGDVLVRDAANATARLPIGTNNQVLTSDGTDVSWEDATGGTFDSLTDTPADKTGSAGLVPVVSDGETDLVYEARRKVLTADLVINVDFAGGGEFTNMQEAWNFAATFASGGFGITINILNVASLTNVADLQMIQDGGDYGHITLKFQAGAQVVPVGLTEGVGPCWTFRNGIAPLIDGSLNQDIDLSNKFRGFLLLEGSSFVGNSLNGGPLLTIRNATQATTSNTNAAIRCEAFSTMSVVAFKILGTNNIAIRVTGGSSASLNHCVMLGTKFGLFVSTGTATGNGFQDFSDGGTFQPTGAVDVSVSAAATVFLSGQTTYTTTRGKTNIAINQLTTDGWFLDPSEPLTHSSLLNQSMDGDFTSGFWNVSKVGLNVTFQWTSGQHLSATSAVTSTPIPEEFRPSVDTNNIYQMTGTAIRNGKVGADGLFTSEYRDWSGNLIADTSSGGGTISWVLDN